MQLYPSKPTLKPPGTKRLTLKCDEPLSDLAFKINLRRYNAAPHDNFRLWLSSNPTPHFPLVILQRGRVARVDPIKTTLKASGTKRLKLEHEKVLSSYAFKFNLRRYSAASR